MDFEFKPPPKLSSLSPAVVAAVSDDELESAVVGYVLDHILDTDREAESLSALPPALRAWYVAFVVDAEVLNGGFNQLFFNPSATLAPAAPTAFAQLGIPAAGDLVSRALALLESHAPALEAAHEAGTVDAFMETYLDQPFSALDGEYAAAEEEWRLARIRFLRQHAAALRHP